MIYTWSKIFPIALINGYKGTLRRSDLFFIILSDILTVKVTVMSIQLQKAQNINMIHRLFYYIP